MRDLDISDLKVPVGRPEEATIVRQDLSEYMIGAKFKRQLNKFFKYWDKVVANKAKGNQRLISNMENFYGEILDKYEELPQHKRVNILDEELPFKLISELTNLKLPEVFINKQDNKDFLSIFLAHKFEA